MKLAIVLVCVRLILLSMLVYVQAAALHSVRMVLRTLQCQLTWLASQLVSLARTTAAKGIRQFWHPQHIPGAVQMREKRTLLIRSSRRLLSNSTVKRIDMLSSYHAMIRKRFVIVAKSFHVVPRQSAAGQGNVNIAQRIHADRIFPTKACHHVRPSSNNVRRMSEPCHIAVVRR